MLGLQVEVRTGDDRIHDALRAVAQRARHDAPPTARAAFAIDREGELLVVREDGEEPIAEVAASAAAEHVGDRVRLRAIDDADPPGLLTAAAGTVDDRRFLLLAEDRRALAHLAVRLSLDGVAIEGAHLVALDDDGDVATLAEPFHLIGEPPAALAEVAAGIAPLAREGYVLRPFHPDPWHVGAGPVDAILDVRLGVSADLRVAEIAHWEAARAAGRHSVARHPARLAAGLARLAGAARVRRVDIPALADARFALDRALR